MTLAEFIREDGHEVFTAEDASHALQLLIEARILAVADTVEAMASHRPYRPALGIELALEEIEQNRGSKFDPEIVNTCLSLFREREFAFQNHAD